jgi:hypothetical protein
MSDQTLSLYFIFFINNALPEVHYLFMKGPILNEYNSANSSTTKY